MGSELRRGKPNELLEVFSISMFSRHITDISSADIEGSVQVTDVANRPMDMFKSKDDTREDSSKDDTREDSILPDGTLRLRGPIRCIAAPYGVVDLSLKDKRHNLNLCHGWFHMSPYTPRVPFDQRVTTLVPGQHGYAAVHFVLYSTAVEAIVEVSLVTGNDATSLYGWISACNDFHEYDCAYDRKYFKSTLFHATKEHPKQVGGGSDGGLKSIPIPLSRSMVAVPMGSNLIIKAQLFDATNIVDDTANFVAETSGSASKTIGGIMIKVNWLVDPFATPGTVRPCPSAASHRSVKRTSAAISE